MIALLDANMLIALFDAAHVHHTAAHAWLTANRSSGWATWSNPQEASAGVGPMGLIIDTNVFVRWERAGQAIDFSRWRPSRRCGHQRNHRLRAAET